MQFRAKGKDEPPTVLESAVRKKQSVSFGLPDLNRFTQTKTLERNETKTKRYNTKISLLHSFKDILSCSAIRFLMY